MIFNASGYAEGISNTAAGSEIEVLGDNITTTRDLLSQLYRSTADSDLREQIEEVSSNWGELLDALRDHPENEGLSFGNDEDDEPDYHHEIRTMAIGSIITFDRYPEDEVERKGENDWTVRHDTGMKVNFTTPSEVVDFLDTP